MCAAENARWPRKAPLHAVWEFLMATTDPSTPEEERRRKSKPALELKNTPHLKAKSSMPGAWPEEEHLCPLLSGGLGGHNKTWAFANSAADKNPFPPFQVILREDPAVSWDSHCGPEGHGPEGARTQP